MPAGSSVAVISSAACVAGISYWSAGAAKWASGTSPMSIGPSESRRSSITGIAASRIGAAGAAAASGILMFETDGSVCVTGRGNGA